MDTIKGIVNKVASRKLAVTAIAGAAAVPGSIELTWPMAAVAVLLKNSRALQIATIVLTVVNVVLAHVVGKIEAMAAILLILVHMMKGVVVDVEALLQMTRQMILGIQAQKIN